MKASWLPPTLVKLARVPINPPQTIGLWFGPMKTELALLFVELEANPEAHRGFPPESKLAVRTA